jgi:hypothetical protein
VGNVKGTESTAYLFEQEEKSRKDLLFSSGSIRFLEVQIQYSFLHKLFDIDDTGQLFESLSDFFLRRVDIGFGAACRRMTEDAFNHQYIDIVVVKMRGQAACAP